MTRRGFLKLLGIATASPVVIARAAAAAKPDIQVISWTGRDYISQGYVYAPYIPLRFPLYVTKDITYNDFHFRSGFPYCYM